MDNDELMRYIAESAVRPNEMSAADLKVEREIMRQVRELKSQNKSQLPQKE